MTQESKEKNFDLSKYQIQTATKKVTLVIEETGDEVELTIKQLSWSKRNQLISKCLTWTDGNKSAFNADLYVRECLKDMIIEAPWGRTTEAFLVTIDERLGTALETLVPNAFGAGNDPSVDTVKKE
tara:strand:+ start:415 stop:792 length:378 start_codon:yes stop_codon:yes gene_type:complete